MGVFAPPSPFFKNVVCVRETEILVEQPPQEVFVCDHAGLVINKLSENRIWNDIGVVRMVRERV